MMSSYDAKSKSEVKDEDNSEEESKINNADGDVKKKERKPRRLMTSEEKAQRKA